MKKLLSSIILFLGLVIWIYSSLAAAQTGPHSKVQAVTTGPNLLINSGAEMGDLTGFEADDPVLVVMTQSQQTGTVLPYEGDYFFSFATQDASFAAMTQTIDISFLSEGTIFEAGGYVQTEAFGGPPDDYGELWIEFRDENGNLLQDYTSGIVEFPQTGGNMYGSFVLTGTIPANSTQTNYILKGYRNDGVRLNVFWDSLFFRELDLTLVVDRTDDEPMAVDCDDAVPSDCSLRGAITKSNADTINAYNVIVPAGIYTLALTSSDEHANVDGDLDITDDVVITGAGARETIIDGNGTVTQDRVFHLVAAGIVVEMSGLTIQNGRAVQEDTGGGTSGADGGGILVSAPLALTVNNSRLTSNFSEDDGGGLYANAAANIIFNQTLIDHNIAGPGPSTPGGGGLLIIGAHMTMNNSTISNNSSTLTTGGADAQVDAILNLNHTTITDNTSDDVNNADGLRTVNGGTINLQNSIVSGNGTIDCQNNSAVMNSSDYNVVGSNGSANGCPTTGSNDVVVAGITDTVLDSTLADNGGPTDTHAIVNGGVAEDAIPGGLNGCGSTYVEDQRGVARPQNGACDVGAYELVPSGTIQGLKYHDQNGNGLQDTNEPPLADWVLFLEDQQGDIITTTTNISGEYTFSDLWPGNYRLTEHTSMGWVMTEPMSGTYNLTVSSGQAITGMDFGNKQQSGEFCATAWDIHLSPSWDFVQFGVGIHNFTLQPHSYDVKIIGFPESDVTLQPQPPIAVGPSSIEHVNVRISPIPTPAKPASPHLVIVTNLDGGYSFTCIGQIWQADGNFWLHNPDGTTRPIAFGEVTTVVFAIQNFLNESLLMGFEIEGMVEGAGNGRNLNSSIVSLNGLPPGQNVTGTVTIQPGETMTFPVQVELMEDTTSFFGDIIFYADMDNDGVVDAATSVMIFPAQPRQLFVPFIMKP